MGKSIELLIRMNLLQNNRTHRLTWQIYGVNTRTEAISIVLNRPYQGLLIVPGIWRTLDDFSSGSVCLVLASEKYDEADYIREYNDFIEYKK